VKTPTRHRNPLRRLGGVLAVLAVAVMVAGCGSFDSKSSGEHLIHNYVNRFGRGVVSLSSVDCPSGIAEKAGTAYSCKVVLRNVQSGRRASGTITVHIVPGHKVEIDGASDVHVR
jgi:hypothetical protein